MPSNPKIISLTNAAKQNLKLLIKKHGGDNCQGIKIGIKTKGCSGFSWDLDFASQIDKTWIKEQIDQELNIYIEPKAMMFIVGVVIDYQETDLEAGFMFQNPNEKGKCGCGESFYV